MNACQLHNISVQIASNSGGSSPAPSGGAKDFIEGTLTSINDSDCTSIRANALRGFIGLTSASFSSATSVGSNAFEGCEDLTSVSLPVAESLTGGAFANCDALEEVNLPAVSWTGGTDFSGCSSLSSVTLPSVTYIGDGEFQNCTGLLQIELGSSTTAVETIGEDAFSGVPTQADSSIIIYTEDGQPLTANSPWGWTGNPETGITWRQID